MSTEAAAAVEGEEPDVLAPDAPDPAEIESKALRMGWTPKDQFRGDPKKYVEAAEYIERGEHLMPLLQANNRKLETANKKLASEVADMRQTMERFAEHHTKTEARAYERALSDLKGQATAAAELGDAAAVNRITGEIATLAADAAKPSAPTKPAPTDDALTEAQDEFIEANPWFNTDRVMKAAAIEIAEEIKAQFPDPKKQLAEVAKRIRTEFPHKFANSRRTEAGAVEGAPARGSRTVGKTYSDLPTDAKAACDDFVKRGLLTREKYAADYFAA